MHRVIAFIHLLDSERTNMIADRHIKSAITAGLGIALTFGISISHPAQALATQIDSINPILSSRRLPTGTNHDAIISIDAGQGWFSIADRSTLGKYADKK